VQFSPDGNYVAASGNTTAHQRFWVYKRDGDTFTKLTDPAAGVGSSTAQSIAWTPDSIYVAGISTTTTAGTRGALLWVYKRLGDAFTRLVYQDLGSTAALGTGFDIEFSPDGVYLAIGLSEGPKLVPIVYKRDGDTFTLLADPVTNSPAITEAGQANPRRVAWTPDGNILFISSGTSPFFVPFARDGDTFTQIPSTTTFPGTPKLSRVLFSENRYMGFNLGSTFYVYKETFPYDTATEFALTTIEQTPSGNDKQLTYIKAEV
jgi:WD40 repeat protein